MRVGILGYGNLGKAIASEIKNTEHELVAIFSRRKIYDGKNNIISRAKLLDYKNAIDTMIIATKSSTEAEGDAMNLIPDFNTIDSFDVHSRIPDYKSRINRVAKKNNHIAVISAGWDPGVLSIARALAKITVDSENINTFWGIGKSLGHTAALMEIEGVKHAVQYTVPITESRILAKNQDAKLSDEKRHRRECLIVPTPFANKRLIEEKIRNMEGYFKGYDTIIHFITEAEFLLNHRRDFHRGEVIATDIKNGEKTAFDMKIKIPSNAIFTAKIMINYINAINYLQNKGEFGVFTPIDIPLSFLISEKEVGEII